MLIKHTETPEDVVLIHSIVSTTGKHQLLAILICVKQFPTRQAHRQSTVIARTSSTSVEQEERHRKSADQGSQKAGHQEAVRSHQVHPEAWEDLQVEAGTAEEDHQEEAGTDRRHSRPADRTDRDRELGQSPARPECRSWDRWHRG